MKKLDGKIPVEAEGFEWMRDFFRRIAFTRLSDGKTVSTAFLGYGEGPFETMAFDMGEELCCYRSRTWEEAEAIHEKVVKELS